VIKSGVEGCCYYCDVKEEKFSIEEMFSLHFVLHSKLFLVYLLPIANQNIWG
jgi:hypothetical protein